ncbi:hypothetical protein HA466_0061670 [Hirschfeldia incana]|nr:hypothetical protein HA466_0160620 [Hirschfeldia incana]KAJ0259874.1 hypothetical protein HA466_0061670 [Hirschfeldia incana]
MCNKFSSSFLLSLQALDAPPVVKPNSYSYRRIHHSIITSSGRRRGRSHLSIHEIKKTLSSSQASCFGAQDSDFLRKFRFREKPSGKFVACSSEEVDSSHFGFLENDSAESPRDSDLIGQVGENDLIKLGL